MPLPGLTTDSSGMGTHTKSHAGQLPVCGKQPITDERIISASPSGRTLADVVGAGRRFRFKYASPLVPNGDLGVGAGRRFRFKYAYFCRSFKGARSGQDAVSGSSTLEADLALANGLSGQDAVSGSSTLNINIGFIIDSRGRTPFQVQVR